LKTLVPWTLLVSVICACSSADPGASRGSAEFSQVYVVIFGFGDARVGAVLIDQEGRRTGWNVDRPIRQIPGCWHGYGSAEGIPDENGPEDKTEEMHADTLLDGREPTPMYHDFTIQGSPEEPGLIGNGGCELRLDPVVSGRVTLAITGSGAAGSGFGYAACKDTTSVMVKTGVALRWWLSWKADDGRCIVRVSRLPIGGRCGR
jgi:hypothetical protein